MADPIATRRLVLVRHAKAGDSVGGGDRSRPLTTKGRQDAARLGPRLSSALGNAPVDALWSSSAVRARETAEALTAGLRNPPEPEWLDDLYDAGPTDLLEALHEAPDEVGVLVVVGHNPTVEVVCSILTGDHEGFRPGTAAVLAVDGPWADLAEGGATLAELLEP